MTQKSPVAPGASWLSPYLMAKDVDKTIDFYQKAFGFNVRSKAPGEDGRTVHAEMEYNKQLIMAGQEGAYDKESLSPASSGVRCPLSLYVYVDNVDDFFKNAIKHGAQIAFEPADMFWGDRSCGLVDLDGYVWCFGTHTGKVMEPEFHHCSSC